jgi:dTDP-4-amino-4,6-dideoxygalactose transaminase
LDHGQSRKYYHDVVGYNGRLDAIQAGVLKVKLRHLSTWNAHRREAAERYDSLFTEASAEMAIPSASALTKHVYHLYVMRVPNRDQFRARLATANVHTGIHYPVPLHLQEAYKSLGYKGGDFPISETAASQVLSLPMYPNLDAEQQSVVVREVLRGLPCEGPRSLQTESGTVSA